MHSNPTMQHTSPAPACKAKYAVTRYNGCIPSAATQHISPAPAFKAARVKHPQVHSGMLKQHISLAPASLWWTTQQVHGTCAQQLACAPANAVLVS